MLIHKKEPADLLAERLNQLHGQPLVEFTHAQYDEIVALAKAANACGLCLSIGGRGTKIYPTHPPYIHFVWACPVAAGQIEVRGSDLRVGVDVPVADVI